MVEIRAGNPEGRKIHVRPAVVVLQSAVGMRTSHDCAAAVVALSVLVGDNYVIPGNAVGNRYTGDFDIPDQPSISGIALVGYSTGGKAVIHCSAAIFPPGADKASGELIAGHRTCGIAVYNLNISTLYGTHKATEMTSGAGSFHRSCRMTPANGHIGRGNQGNQTSGIMPTAGNLDVFCCAIRNGEGRIARDIRNKTADVCAGSACRY